MINGRVTGQREAIIRITIEGRRGRKRNVAAVVDTGFNGHLSLPQSLIADLRLPWKRYGRAILADGSESLFDVHEGIVLWDGRARPMAIDAADMCPLVGMALMDGYELIVRVRKGGSVILQPLPRRDGMEK